MAASAKRILVVDDEELVRMVMRSVLTTAGFQVVEASDGRDAVRQYAEANGAIDLVLLDQQMPQLSGRETLDALRQCDPAVRVVLLSGGVPDGETERALASGNLRFLSKPFLNQELVRVVRQSLDG
jgi:CheY-like chemotaxis protein